MKTSSICLPLGAALIAAALAAAPVAARSTHGHTSHQDSSGRIGPPLDTVKAFEDDFRLVGIGVSAKGRVFATAPASRARSRYSMVEVNPKTGDITPYPDAAWNNFNEQSDGKSQWVSVEAL